MPRVPYNPVPSVEPVTPSEQVRINVPSEAFGTNIGAGMEHVGAAMQHYGTTFASAGKDLTDIALSFQALNNETEARAKASAYVEQQGLMQSNFDSLQGKEQVDALQGHLDASRKLMTDIRSSISSPAAQRMYDGMTFGFMGRTIRESSSRAGTAQKKFTADGYDSEAEMNLNSIEQHPGDVTNFEVDKKAAVAAAKRAAMVRRGTEDPEDPVVKEAGQQAAQKALSKKLTGMAQDHPLEALDLFAKSRAELGAEADRIGNYIETRGLGTIERNIVERVMSAHAQPDGTYDLTDKQMRDEVNAAVDKIFPDNPEYAGRVKLAASHSLSYKVRTEDFDRTADRRRTDVMFDDFLAKNPDIWTADQLLANPTGKRIADRYGAYDHTLIQTKIQNARTKEFSTEWAINKAQLDSLRATDPVGYINQDLDRWNLKPTDRIDLRKKQDLLTEDPRQLPQVTAAMNMLLRANGPQMSAMGIKPEDRKNLKSTYNTFQGVLLEALEEWQQDNKKPAGPEDILGPIWQKVSTKVAVPPGFWSRFTAFPGTTPTDTEYAFKKWIRPQIEEVPAEYKAMAEEEARKAHMPTLTPNQIYRVYIRDRFKETVTEPEKKVKP